MVTKKNSKSKSAKKKKPIDEIEDKNIPKLKSAYFNQVVPEMMKEFSFTNKLRTPIVEKVVVSIGLGEALTSSNVIEAAKKDLQLITGQRPIETKAKKSVANFKLREGQVIGLSEQVMFPEIDYNEIDKLRGLQINIVTTAYNDSESKKLLELLGLPFEDIN